MAGDAANDKKAVILVQFCVYSKEGEPYGGPAGFNTRVEGEANRAAHAIASMMSSPVDSVKVRSLTGWNGGGVGPAKVLIVPHDVELL